MFSFSSPVFNKVKKIFIITFIIKNLYAHITSVDDVVNSTLGFSSRYAWYSNGFCNKK
ncbi:hypothetical protein [uncultured Gammaproteobacteria bacterium]|nr:hypothetical protein [uncultured Gammaproteobacteria bacterium]CAC9559416.1 hypothetical protein [uncultured Gammaproteobacteria bacterium]CAC9564083.1 hypothetical protein [uncultured Gammaproteobacteria bacterium]CAC9569049.1 hypothetical protein [uncultured Gammaproteobacteria bacterium]